MTYSVAIHVCSHPRAHSNAEKQKIWVHKGLGKRLFAAFATTDNQYKLIICRYLFKGTIGL